MTSPDVLQLIPHRPPMVFIDRVLSHSEDSIEAELDIRSELLFAQADGLPSWCAIEIMAQTISAYAGLQGRARGEPPQVGYLLGSRRLALPLAFFEFGKTLKVRATQHYMHESLGQFQCEIRYEQQVISATLSVYQPSHAVEEITPA